MIYIVLFLAYLISGIFLFLISYKIYRFWNKIPHVEATNIIYWVQLGIFFISLALLIDAFSPLSHLYSILLSEIMTMTGGLLFLIGLILFIIGSIKSLKFILKIIS